MYSTDQNVRASPLRPALSLLVCRMESPSKTLQSLSVGVVELEASMNLAKMCAAADNYC